MTEKIRVLHISKYYPPYIGGIESFCHDIASALRDTGDYEQVVFCYNDKNETVEEVYDGVKVIRVGIQRIIASQPLAKGYGKRLKNVINEFKPDIVHFCYPNPYAAHFLLKTKFKSVFHLDWICDIIKQKFLKQFFRGQNRRLLKRADLVTSITPTYFENTDYLPYYEGDKDAIPCRVGDARLNPTEEQKQKADLIKDKYRGKSVVFFYGRHTRYKGLKHLIEANGFLDREKVQLVIAGQGALTEELKEQAASYENVDFVGRLTDDDINSYLMACDIFAFPSITRNEAFGIALAEAMYYGKPACTFTIPGSGVNWVSKNGVTCLEAPNGDSKKFAENIMRLVNDDQLRGELGKNGKARCEELFLKPVFDKKVIEVYRCLSEKVRTKNV